MKPPPNVRACRSCAFFVGVMTVGTANAGMVDPVMLVVSMVWFPLCLLVLIFLAIKFVPWAWKGRHQPWFPALAALLVGFFLTPIPNRYDQYVPSLMEWLGVLFLRPDFWHGASTAFVACAITTIGGWSILWAAGRLSFGGARTTEKEIPGSSRSARPE